MIYFVFVAACGLLQTPFHARSCCRW